jgi:hypothetical protein
MTKKFRTCENFCTTLRKKGLVDFQQQAFSTLPPGALNQNRRERVAKVSRSALREHFVALEAEDVQF